MSVGGSGVEALFWRGPVVTGDVASWLTPGVLVDGGGGGGGGGSSFPPFIFLNDNVVVDNSSIGTVIGAMSVIGTATGFTFSIVYDPGSLFQVAGSSLEVGSSLSGHDGMNPVVLHATNGAVTYDYGYVIFVIPAAVVSNVNFLFNFAQNSHYLGII